MKGKQNGKRKDKTIIETSDYIENIKNINFILSNYRAYGVI